MEFVVLGLICVSSAVIGITRRLLIRLGRKSDIHVSSVLLEVNRSIFHFSANRGDEIPPFVLWNVVTHMVWN